MADSRKFLTFRDLKAKVPELLRKPSFMAGLLVCAAAGYWIPLVRPAIGMDDTAAAVDYYINQGGLVMQGRFTTFLIQRILPLVQFDPRPSEVAQLLFLILGGIIFAAALLAASDRPAGMSSLLVAGTLVVYPLQAELYVFTGLGAVAFPLAAVGSFCLVVACQDKLRWRLMAVGMLLIAFSAACYETFLIVAFTQCMGVLLLLCKRWKLSLKDWRVATAKLVAGLVGALALKMLLSKACIWVLQDQLQNVKNDSASDIRWLTEGNVFQTFIRLIREFLIDYVATAFDFYPLALFWGCVLVALGFAFAWGRKKRWPLVWSLLLICVAQFALSVVQGKSQMLRTCQNFAPFCGFILWMAWQWVTEHPVRWRRCLVGTVLALVMVGQTVTISELFRMDSDRWDYERSVLLDACQAVYELDGADTKPVVFVGQVELPQELMSRNTINNPDAISQKIAYLVRVSLGGANNQLQRSQNMLTSVLNWGQWAFQQPQTQIHDLANSLGYPVQPCTQEQLEQGWAMVGDLEPGQVVETEELIVVRFQGSTEVNFL